MSIASNHGKIRRNASAKPDLGIHPPASSALLIPAVVRARVITSSASFGSVLFEAMRPQWRRWLGQYCGAICGGGHSLQFRPPRLHRHADDGADDVSARDARLADRSHTIGAHRDGGRHRQRRTVPGIGRIVVYDGQRAGDRRGLDGAVTPASDNVGYSMACSQPSSVRIRSRPPA